MPDTNPSTTITLTRGMKAGFKVSIGDRYQDGLPPDEALYAVALFITTGTTHPWLKTEVQWATERVKTERVCPNCQKDRIIANMGRAGDLCERCKSLALLEQEKRDFHLADNATEGKE